MAMGVLLTLGGTWGRKTSRLQEHPAGLGPRRWSYPSGSDCETRLPAGGCTAFCPLHLDLSLPDFTFVWSHTSAP